MKFLFSVPIIFFANLIISAPGWAEDIDDYPPYLLTVQPLLESDVEQLLMEIRGLEKILEENEATIAEIEGYLALGPEAMSADAWATFLEAKARADEAYQLNTVKIQSLADDHDQLKRTLDLLPDLGNKETQAIPLKRWGEVNILRAAGAAYLAVAETLPASVKKADQIEVGEVGGAIYLYPEAFGEMALGSSTRAVITQVGKSNDPRVLLMEGKIRFWLGRSSRYLKHLADKALTRNRFTIRTPTMVSGVRQTDFAVIEIPDVSTEILVFDGEVTITPEGSDEEITVSTGERVVIGPDGLIEGPAAFDPEQIEHWWEEGRTDEQVG